MSKTPTAAGKSSYDLIDKDVFWKSLALAPGMTVLDLASGEGRYALPLAERVGPEGKVVAVDLWPEGIKRLNAAAADAKLNNVTGYVANAGQALPIMADSVDLCLIATVLHDFVADGIERDALREVQRILKPAGILAVVEFKKQDGPPGPPKAVRLTLEDVTRRLMPFGLIRFGAVVELGAHAYMAQFRTLAASRQATESQGAR